MTTEWRFWAAAGIVIACGWHIVGAGDAMPPSSLPVAGRDEPIRGFCIDFNWGPGGINGFAGPGVWAGADPRQHIAWYDGLGANVVQTFAVSCNGYAWYKGGTVPAQPDLKHDFLAEMVRLGHQRGMKVMGYFCIGANTLWAQKHPELSYGTPSAPHIPFTDAYLDYLCGSIEDALKKTGMDGFMVDWVWNPDDGVRTGKWLDCEKQLYQQLLGNPFPADGKLAAQDRLAYERKAIDRCWGRIRQAAKRVAPDCVIWLSCNDLHAPSVVDSTMLREVDWLMNEATDPRSLEAVERMKGPRTRLVQCLVGWGDAHDARKTLTGADGVKFGVYGFAKPGDSSLPLPIAEYRDNPILQFMGNDRNIATLLRFFRRLPMEAVTPQASDGRVLLLPQAAGANGNSPVFMDGQIGHWGKAGDSVFWRFQLAAPGTFDVYVTQACQKGFGGSHYGLAVHKTTLEAITEDTGTWRNYVRRPLGKVTIDKAGQYALTITPGPEPKWKSVSLQSVELVPAR
jgi:hypothetical protein